MQSLVKKPFSLVSQAIYFKIVLILYCVTILNVSAFEHPILQYTDKLAFVKENLTAEKIKKFSIEDSTVEQRTALRQNYVAFLELNRKLYVELGVMLKVYTQKNILDEIQKNIDQFDIQNVEYFKTINPSIDVKMQFFPNSPILIILKNIRSENKELKVSGVDSYQNLIKSLENQRNDLEEEYDAIPNIELAGFLLKVAQKDCPPNGIKVTPSEFRDPESAWNQSLFFSRHESNLLNNQFRINKKNIITGKSNSKPLTEKEVAVVNEFIKSCIELLENDKAVEFMSQKLGARDNFSSREMQLKAMQFIEKNKAAFLEELKKNLNPKNAFKLEDGKIALLHFVKQKNEIVQARGLLIDGNLEKPETLTYRAKDMIDLEKIAGNEIKVSE